MGVTPRVGSIPTSGTRLRFLEGSRDGTLNDTNVIGYWFGVPPETAIDNLSLASH